MKDNSNKVNPLLQSALIIFVKELESHLGYFEQILLQINTLKETPEPMSEKRAEEIQKKFHLIKGGAGFLGLEEISRSAIKGEQLITPNSNSVDFGKLATVVQTMRNQYNQLRVAS